MAQRHCKSEPVVKKRFARSPDFEFPVHPREIRLTLRFLFVLVKANLFARLKAHCLSGWNGNLISCTRISTNPALSWFDHEDAKSAQLNPITPLHGRLQRIENRLNCLFGFNFRDSELSRNPIHNVLFDHCPSLGSLGILFWKCKNVNLKSLKFKVLRGFDEIGGLC